MELPEQIEKEIIEIFNMFSIDGEIENTQLPKALQILGITLKKKQEKEKLNFDDFLTIILKHFDYEDEKLITGFDLFDFDKTFEKKKN